MIIIGQVRNIEHITAYFELKPQKGLCYEKKWAVYPGESLLGISVMDTKSLIEFNFGLRSDHTTYYEVPIEGNTEDKVSKKRILASKEFNIPLRYRRCIIPADYFIIKEGENSYLFFNKDREPLAIAGIYNCVDGIHCFSPLTFRPYGLFHKIGLSKVPMLVPNRSKRWLREYQHLVDISEQLFPMLDEYLNGFKVDHSTLVPGNNKKEIIKPLGPNLKANTFTPMNPRRTKAERPDSGISWGDRLIHQ